MTAGVLRGARRYRSLALLLLLVAIAPAFIAARVTRCGPTMACMLNGDFDATGYGAAPDDGVADQAGILAAWNACTAAGGGTVLLPGPGTYNITANITIAGNDCTLAGSGRGVTLVDAQTAANPLITSGNPTNIGFRDFTMISGASTFNLLSLAGGGSDVRIERMGFDFTVLGASIGISMQGVNGVLVRDCRFDGKGNTGTATAITMTRGSRNVDVDHNWFDQTYNGVQIIGIGSNDGFPSDIKVRGNNTFFSWWQYAPYNVTNAADTSGTSFSDTQLFDTLGNLSGMLANDTFRILPLREPAIALGTFSPYGKYTRTDGGSFLTSSVAEGDRLQTATAYAVVDYVEDADELWTKFGWRSLTTGKEVAPPATNEAVSIRRLLLAQRHATTVCTATVCTFNGFGIFDWRGNPITGVPPVPSGTLYEGVIKHTNYCLQAEVSAHELLIAENDFHACWSDSISCGSSFNTTVQNGCRVIGNHIERGQDSGVTMNGVGGLIEGNTIDSMGAVGVYAVGPRTLVLGNNIKDSGTVNWFGAVADILLQADGVVAMGNTVERVHTQPGANYGISFRSNGATGMSAIQNTCKNHNVSGIRIDTSGGAAQSDLIVRGNPGCTVSVETSAGLTTFRRELEKPRTLAQILAETATYSVPDLTVMPCTDCAPGSDPATASAGGDPLCYWNKTRLTCAGPTAGATTPTATPSATPTKTVTPTRTATPSFTPTPTPTGTP